MQTECTLLSVCLILRREKLDERAINQRELFAVAAAAAAALLSTLYEICKVMVCV